MASATRILFRFSIDSVLVWFTCLVQVVDFSQAYFAGV